MKNAKLDTNNSYKLLVFGSQKLTDMGRSELRAYDFESAKPMNVKMDGGNQIKQYTPQEYRISATDVPESYFTTFIPFWVRVPHKYRPIGRDKVNVVITLDSLADLMKIEDLKIPA